MKDNIKKYDVWLIDLEPVKGSEQAGTRPCIIIHNNLFFQFQNTSIVLPITSTKKDDGNFRIKIKNYKDFGLDKESTILSFQIRTVDKSRFIKKLGEINDLELREKIRNSIKLTLDFDDELLK